MEWSALADTYSTFVRPDPLRILSLLSPDASPLPCQSFRRFFIMPREFFETIVTTFLAEGARRPMSERTLAIIKPDAVKKNAIGDIINRYEKAELRPVAIRLMQLSKATAQGFYAVHKARPFFDSLCTFMSSGPCVVLVLQGDNAIKTNREIMGATDPAKAEHGTIRAAHGANIEFNAVHGSDAPDTAKFEIGYFFSEMELVG